MASPDQLAARSQDFPWWLRVIVALPMLMVLAVFVLGIYVVLVQA